MVRYPPCQNGTADKHFQVLWSVHLVPDTYSEKVIPALIRMKVQLESTLPVSTMKRQGKAKMKQVQDNALSTIEY